MFAVGMVRGEQGVHSFDLPMPEIKRPDEVLVGVKQVGLDGTDFGMVRRAVQDIAEGRENMAMGHEMVGIVEAVGSSVESLSPGDLVTMTVRRGCGLCHPCLHNQSDMCMTGLFTERGIHKLDGYLTEYVVDREQYAVRVPPGAAELAVLAEPVSIAEKAIEQITIIQARLPWTCPHPDHGYGHGFTSESWGSCLNALVVGAGPLGLLATALLRLHDLNTWTADIVSEDHVKARTVRRLGGTYADARERSAQDLVEMCSLGSGFNIIIDASGAAETALELVNHLARSSIYVMTGIPREGLLTQVDSAEIVRHIVRRNEVIVGSVNSNRSHFEMALRDIPRLDARFPGMLPEMVTDRYALEDFANAFGDGDPKHIKTVIEVQP